MGGITLRVANDEPLATMLMGNAVIVFLWGTMRNN